jgi:hypothetical protein
VIGSFTDQSVLPVRPARREFRTRWRSGTNVPVARAGSGSFPGYRHQLECGADYCATVASMRITISRYFPTRLAAVPSHSIWSESNALTCDGQIQ